MLDFSFYILKSAICLIVLYLFVKVLLSNETFFRFNRVVLLVGISVCAILPLVKINVGTMHYVQRPFVELENMMMYSVTSEDYIANLEYTTEQEIVAPEKFSINWMPILAMIYILGCCVNLIILLRSFFRMSQIIRHGRKIRHQQYVLVLIDGEISPFSWSKYIVLSESDYQDNPEEIICHEQAHIRHRHSWDLLYVEVIILLQWFNPAVWLLKRELRDIHEYQADVSVLEKGINATKYQLLLVKKAVGASSYTLANSFNHSKIKKRITMMLKEKSKKWARFKLLLVLPLVVLSLYAFAQPELNDQFASYSEDKSTIILSESEITGEVQIATPYYLVDNKEYSIRDYEALVKNGQPFVEKEYIPFAEGKVVKVQFVDREGKSSAPSYVELSEGGKSRNMSHVNVVVDGKKMTYEAFKKEISTGEYYQHEESIEKKERGRMLKCHFESLDGVKFSPKWYSLKKPKFTPPPPPPTGKQISVKYTKEDREAAKKRLADYFERTGYKSVSRIGALSTGHYKLMSMSHEIDQNIECTVFPDSYNSKANGVESDYIRIYWYIIDGKKYHTSKFIDKCRNGKVFLDRSKIQPSDGRVVKVEAILTNGASAPDFYMAIFD